MKRPYKSACYCTNLRRSANVITDYYNDIFRDTDITAAQYYMLVNISRLGETTAGELADLIGLERSTLVRNLKILVRKGWVSDAPKGHGIRNMFSLTGKGVDTVNQAKDRWDKAQADLLEFLGEEDVNAIIRISEKLQDLRESRNE